MTGFVLL